MQIKNVSEQLKVFFESCSKAQFDWIKSDLDLKEYFGADNRRRKGTGLLPEEADWLIDLYFRECSVEDAFKSIEIASMIINGYMSFKGLATWKSLS
jgi:hypothetical protein